MKKNEKQKYTLFTAKALLFLIAPICVEAALSMSLGLVDSFMVKDIGNYGTAMSAVSNVDQVSSLLIQLFAAFGVGGAVITSQLIGAGKLEEANRSAKQLVVLMLLASLVIMTVCLALNHQIVNLFFGGKNDNDEYLSFAYTYFYVMAASFPFLAVFNSCAAILRAQRKSLNTLVSGVISFFANIGFNALLIYVCKLGILGAALGTLFARIIPALVVVALLSKKSNIVRIRVFEKFRFNGGLLKKIVKLALPSGIENCLFQLGKLMVISFITISFYWTDGINIHNTANTVAYQINSISSMVGNGVNTAILTVIGQAVGTGDTGCVKYYIKKMLLINYVANAACVLTTMALSPVLIGFFGDNITAETAKIAQNCLWACLTAQLFTYPLSFGLPAVLKANSDMRYVMFSAVSSMLIMRVGLCYVLTCDLVGLHLGAYGLWIGMIADWIVRSVLFGARLISGRWKKSSGLLTDGPAAA